LSRIFTVTLAVVELPLKIYTSALGEKDEALEWLEMASDDRSEMLAWLKVAPELDRLRPDPRFASIMRRVGFAT